MEFSSDFQLVYFNETLYFFLLKLKRRNLVDLFSQLSFAHIYQWCQYFWPPLKVIKYEGRLNKIEYANSGMKKLLCLLQSLSDTVWMLNCDLTIALRVWPGFEALNAEDESASSRRAHTKLLAYHGRTQNLCWHIKRVVAAVYNYIHLDSINWRGFIFRVRVLGQILFRMVEKHLFTICALKTL